MWKKMVKLNKETAILEENKTLLLIERGRELPSTLNAYQTLCVTHFANFSGPPKSERRNHHVQEAWKKGLRDYYGSWMLEEPGQEERQGKLWCPIMKEYHPFKSMCASHIISHSQGYANVAYMLGDKGDVAKGSAHIWNFGNGLVIYKALKKQFDDGDFVIVPIPNGPHVPARLRFVLLNTADGHHRVNDYGPRYSELDGRELEFKTTERPGYRYLYWHYITCLLRAVKRIKGAPESIKAKIPNGPIWSTPGAYMRKSMSKHLGRAIGDYDVDDREFEEGLFGGVGGKSAEEEVAIAAKAAEAFEEISSGEDDEYDEDDD